MEFGNKLAEYLRQGADTLTNLPTEAQRFLTNPQAFTQLVTGKNPLPKETGFVAGATGLPTKNPVQGGVLNPASAPYQEGYEQGEPVAIASMALPAYATALRAGAPKAYNALENYMVNQGFMPSAVPIYHSTSKEAAENIGKRGFDQNKSYDTTTWFTTSPNPVETGASGQGAVIKRLIDEDKLKLASMEDVDKYFIDQLISQGYQGVKYPQRGLKGDETYYQMFYPNKLGKEKVFRKELIQEQIDKPVTQSSLQSIVDPIRDRGLTLDVYESKKAPIITLSRIEVPKEMRGTGMGTQALQDLSQYADQSAKTIALSPSKDFGASSVNRLKDFYKRFGFIENKGKNKDFSISESMYRLPTQTTRKDLIQQQIDKIE